MSDRILFFPDIMSNRFRKIICSPATIHALIDLTETIKKALNDNRFACGVFLGFKKAFDMVNHKILLKKLEHYGVRGHTVKWFSSYLTERKQNTDTLSQQIS